MNNKKLCPCADNKYKENDSCFTKQQILDMALGFNRFMTKSNLERARILLIPDKYIKDQDTGKLLEYIRSAFSAECKNDDKCMVDKILMRGILKNIDKNEIFKPDGPATKTEWLSNFDIQNIMKNYENKYPHFKFAGAVASNCHKHNGCTLNRFDIKKYLDKSYIGIIFNLDVVGGSGSHWTSFLVDIPNKKIYYVDSGGNRPNSHIQDYIDSVLRDIPSVELIVNDKKFQFDSSECGVYSMNFIIRILSGETYDSILNNPLSFEQINSCRDLYFYNPVSSQNDICKKCDPTVQ